LPPGVPPSFVPADWIAHGLRKEMYGEPHEPREPSYGGALEQGEYIFGGGQFSMTRAWWEKLGCPLFDEGYAGYGYEDQSFMQEIRQRAVPNYCGAIRPESTVNALHREHPYRAWRTSACACANLRRYVEKWHVTLPNDIALELARGEKEKPPA